MKHIAFILLLVPGWMFAQSNTKSYQNTSVVVGAAKPTNSSVILEASSTTKGFVPPRMTTAQRNALTAIAGMQIYNTDLNVMQHYDGSSWVNEAVIRDTVALATFGGGSGATRDTAVFSTSAIYGSFYNDGTDTLVITSMRIGLQGTSPSVVVDVIYNDTLNVTGTKLVTAGSTATNTAGGTSVTSFNNTKIPPGNWVWAKTTTVTTKPTYMNITIIGYRKRKA